MQINQAQLNSQMPLLTSQIAKWHYDRNLIDGATDNSQFTKLLEEMMELFMSINPGMDPNTAVTSVQAMLDKMVAKGKVVTAESSANLADDIGDVSVVLINIAERNNMSMQQCYMRAWEDIKDRKGKMIDGVFVKEADLPENS